MADTINEINIWDNNSPVINMTPEVNQSGTVDFDIWDNNAPVLDVPTPDIQVVTARRRAAIF